jgi:undecaprenyl-diphosphatase
MQIKQIFKSDAFIEVFGKINLLISCFCLACFAWLSWQVIAENLNEFDESFLQLLHETLPSSFIYVAKPLYFLGEAEVAVFIVLLSLAILCWRRLWLEAQVVAASSLTVLLLIDKVLKPLFNRRRPLGRLVENIHGRSFPSGHATGNLLLYFLLVYIISVRFPKQKIKLYIIATIILLLMGLGSTYLRVHWLTDILGGYCLGYILFTLSLGFLRISAKK